MMKFLISLQSGTFLMAALLHLGVRIGPLQEPRIVPATIVESLCGLFLAFAACGLFTRRAWARGVAIAAHVFAIAGVVLGIVSLALGRGPRTESNDIYHRVMLVLLGIGLALLLLRSGKPARPALL